MADKKRFSVVRVSDTTYLDDAQQVVQGVSVQVRLLEYDEVRFVNTPNDDPKTIKTAIENLLVNRKALFELG